MACLALVIRILHLNSTDIAGDETFSIFVAQFNPTDIVAYLSTGNNPPLFELLLHFYIVCFGDSDFALRLLPSVFSAAAVIPIFLAGNSFFNRRVALMASVLLVFSIYQIRFAHEIRVYSFFTFVTAWSMYFFLSVVERPSSIKLWSALVFCNVILMYSHFTSFYVLFTELVCGILFIPKNKWKFLIGALALSSLFYLPYLLVFLSRLNDITSSGTWVAPPGWGELYGSINLMLNQRLTTASIIAVIAFGLILSRKIGALEIARQMLSERKALTVIVWFVLPYTLMFLCSVLVVPMFIDRYILYTSIPLFLCVSLVIDQVWKNTRLPFVGAVLVGCASITTTNLNPPNNREVQSAVEFVRTKKTDSSTVYVCPDHYNLAFAFHYNRTWFNQAARQEKNAFQELDELLRMNGIYPIRAKSQLQFEESNRVIYFDADSKFVLPQNDILATLNSKFNLTETAHFEQIFDVHIFDSVPESNTVNPTQTSE